MKFINIKIPIPNLAIKICDWILCKYRKYKYGYAFRQIQLTKGKVAIVDADDFYLLNKYKWCASKRGYTFYAARSETVNKKRKTILMHRQVMNADSQWLVDHVNHDGLDNRKQNLRLATYCQNNTNTRKRIRTGKSKYRGVQWSKQRNKWIAIIRYQKNRKFLGYFNNEIDAAKEYDKAAKKYHGKFAQINLTK